MRMHMRRFTRLTNAFSKKVENHAYAVVLHMMYYNVVRVHSKLRMSPAMAAGRFRPPLGDQRYREAGGGCRTRSEKAGTIGCMGANPLLTSGNYDHS